MRTPNVWPYFMPTSVGALMDPTFLRDAVNDAAMRPLVDHAAQPAVKVGWGERLAALSSWTAAHCKLKPATATECAPASKRFNVPR